MGSGPLVKKTGTEYGLLAHTKFQLTDMRLIGRYTYAELLYAYLHIGIFEPLLGLYLLPPTFVLTWILT